MIKIIAENHKENDKIKAIMEQKKAYDMHTIVCEKCNARFHFYPENIKVVGGKYGTAITGANVSCPCCRHINKIETSIAIFDNALFIPDDKRNKKMDVLSPGNFSMEIECDNCESKFSFNYDDTVKKEFKDVWSYTDIDIIQCPVCGKELRVEDNINKKS